jgi:precorrin-3B C17-methyltransferase
LEAACAGDFVIALYNPLSKARPHQLGEAFGILRRHKPPSTIVVMVRAAGSGEMRRITTTLSEVDPAKADMRTLVLIGSSATRLIARVGGEPWVYTPRREELAP